MSEGALAWRKNMSWWEAPVGADARMVLDVSDEEWGLSVEICDSFGSREEAEGVAEEIGAALRDCFKGMQ